MNNIYGNPKKDFKKSLINYLQERIKQLAKEGASDISDDEKKLLKIRRRESTKIVRHIEKQ